MIPKAIKIIPLPKQIQQLFTRKRIPVLLVEKLRFIMAQVFGNPEWDLILSAAHKNLPIRIREMVETQGVDPSHSNGVGQSALHIAALWGNGACRVS